MLGNASDAIASVVVSVPKTSAVSLKPFRTDNRLVTREVRGGWKIGSRVITKMSDMEFKRIAGALLTGCRHKKKLLDSMIACIAHVQRSLLIERYTLRRGEV